MGAKYKCMRTVKVTKKTTRVHKSVLERRKWAKFGQAELVELKNPGFHDLASRMASRSLTMPTSSWR